MAFKVFQSHRGRYQSKARMWPPISNLEINSNWHPISYRFGVIASYCSNFRHFTFSSHPLGLRDNVQCSSWAHLKAHSGLPINVNWTFFARGYSWVATSEKRSKIGDFAPTRSLWSKISGRRGRLPLIIFARLVRPMNALQLTRNFVADFLQGKCDFFMEIDSFAFLRPPLGDLGSTYDDHLRLIGKCVVDFLLALIELFSLGVTAEALWAIISSKLAILLLGGSWPKISGRRGRPPPTILLLSKLG